jgi:transposase-like protein
MASVASIRAIKQQLEAGQSTSSVAKEFALSRTTVWRISAGKIDLRRRQAVQDKCDALLQEMRSNPFLTTRALANQLGVETQRLYGVRQILRKQLAALEQKQTPQTSSLGIDMSYVDFVEGKFSAKEQRPKKPKVPKAVDVLLQKHGIA